MPIELDDWTFGSNRFTSAKELCEFISVNDRQFQGRINKYLEAHPAYIQWKKSKRKLQDLPHFKKYRKSKDSRLYHASVKSLFDGTYKPADQSRVQGLLDEIKGSAVILAKGQKLFHGMSFRVKQQNISLTFNQFLSCTLCPEVAAYHAISKGHRDSSGAVLILEINEPVAAMFGPAGKLDHEHELLLACGAQIEIQAVHEIKGGEFNIVEGKLVNFILPPNLP